MNCTVKIVQLLIPLMLFSSTVTAADSKLYNQLKEQQHYLEKEMKRIGIVGGSLMINQQDDTISEFYYGYQDANHNIPITKDSIYHWASNTKMFTGIAIMQLHERGKLQLDDSIIHYLPELRKVRNPFGPMKDITLRHLLSHSSGFRGSSFPWKSQKWQPHEPSDWSQLVAMVPYTEIKFKPGSKYAYSNPGIIMLGKVIEQISGDDYEVYIEKNIFKPLKMYDSYFDHTPYHLLQYRSNNFTIVNGERTINGIDFDTGVTVSNGGLNAPLDNIKKFADFLIGVGPNRTLYNSVLRRNSLNKMLQLQHHVEEGRPRHDEVGLTIFKVSKHGISLFGHTGGQKGFSTFIYVHPESQSSAILAFNTNIYSLNNDKTKVISRETSDLLYGFRDRLMKSIFPLLN